VTQREKQTNSRLVVRLELVARRWLWTEGDRPTLGGRRVGTGRLHLRVIASTVTPVNAAVSALSPMQHSSAILTLTQESIIRVDDFGRVRLHESPNPETSPLTDRSVTDPPSLTLGMQGAKLPHPNCRFVVCMYEINTVANAPVI